jgi:putative ATPase
LREITGRALRDTERGLGFSLSDPRAPYTLTKEAENLLISASGGDARALYGALESAAALQPDGGEIDEAVIASSFGERQSKAGEPRHELMSALIKSIRGSDVDASLYWLARLELAGEDPRVVSRRLLVSAAEEMSLSSPEALPLAAACTDAAERVGPPECWIPLAGCAAYLARAPKNWAAYDGFRRAQDFVRRGPQPEVPLHLRNPVSAVDREEGAGRGYIHAREEGAETMRFMPPEFIDVRLFGEN